jgi:hypothetical protein
MIQCRRLPRGAPRGDGAGAQDVRSDGSAGHAVCRSAAARDAGVQGQVWAQQVLRLPAVLVQKYKYTSKASKLSGDRCGRSRYSVCFLHWCKSTNTDETARRALRGPRLPTLPQFTCFTSTTVKILTQVCSQRSLRGARAAGPRVPTLRLRCAAYGAGTQFTCFTGTRAHILTRFGTSCSDATLRVA